MYSTIMTGAVHGITSYLLRVETNISSGLPSFHMVGFMPIFQAVSPPSIWSDS